MWLLRELVPYLPPIVIALARLALTLLVGGAIVILALRGGTISDALLRTFGALIH
jgi:hypothetical protein